MDIRCTLYSVLPSVVYNPAFLPFFIYLFILKIYFYYFVIGKADIQRGETERKIFRPMIHSPSERNGPILCDLKPGDSSGSPMRVQGPKALGHPRLPSRATGRELEGKQGYRD